MKTNTEVVWHLQHVYLKEAPSRYMYFGSFLFKTVKNYSMIEENIKKVLIFKIRRKYRITVNYALKTVLRWTFTWITIEKLR